MKKVLFLCFSLVFSVVAAQNCCGDIEVFGDAIYVRPSACDFNYLIEDATFIDRIDTPPIVPMGPVLGICPDYEWGLRIGVGYVLKNACIDGRAYYSRLCSRDSTSVALGAQSVAGLWPTYVPSALLNFGIDGIEPNLPATLVSGTGFEIPASAFQRVRLEWDAIDAEVASRQTVGCRLWIRSHIGLHWAEIRLKRQVHYEGATLPPGLTGQNAFVDNETRSHAWGIGPRIGCDMRYDLFCGLGIGAHAGAALLSGEIRYCSNAMTRLERTDGQEIELKQAVAEPDRCIVFPEFDAALGVNYLWCCGCFTLFGEVGYEFRTYLNTIRDSDFLSSEARGAHTSTCDPFSFNGLYIRGSVAF